MLEVGCNLCNPSGFASVSLSGASADDGLAAAGGECGGTFIEEAVGVNSGISQSYSAYYTR